RERPGGRPPLSSLLPPDLRRPSRTRTQGRGRRLGRSSRCGLIDLLRTPAGGTEPGGRSQCLSDARATPAISPLPGRAWSITPSCLLAGWLCAAPGLASVESLALLAKQGTRTLP